MIEKEKNLQEGSQKREPSLLDSLPHFKELFWEHTRDFKAYLLALERKCELYDIRSLKADETTALLRELKSESFPIFDQHFKAIWELLKKCPTAGFYKELRKGYFNELSPLLGEKSEINWHIYTKPYGYPGDYKTMNYIYDYHGDNYPGKGLFEKLVNNYTCNIAIARSNNIRKNYLKEKIRSIIASRKFPDILSIGSGPAREVTEILEEEGDVLARFSLLDIEEEALQCARRHLEGVSLPERATVEYIHKDIMSLLKFKDMGLGKYDMIYISGFFDYLPVKTCKRMTGKVFELLRDGGEMLVFNISEADDFHRAYYEFLGGWEMIRKTGDQLLSCASSIAEKCDARLVPFEEDFKYLIMSIVRIK